MSQISDLLLQKTKNRQQIESQLEQISEAQADLALTPSKSQKSLNFLTKQLHIMKCLDATFSQ